jgi:hypothetical protein
MGAARFQSDGPRSGDASACRLQGCQNTRLTVSLIYDRRAELAWPSIPDGANDVPLAGQSPLSLLPARVGRAPPAPAPLDGPESRRGAVRGPARAFCRAGGYFPAPTGLGVLYAFPSRCLALTTTSASSVPGRAAGHPRAGTSMAYQSDLIAGRSQRLRPSCRPSLPDGFQGNR